MVLGSDSDAIVFTAGVGEHQSGIRRRSLAGLEGLGVDLDPATNEAAEPRDGPVAINSPESATAVLVISTNEELEIAHQVSSVVAKR